MFRRFATVSLFACIVGCSNPEASRVSTPVPEGTTSVAESSKKIPVFTLAVSEYPSWSTFIVAGKMGIINPAEGGEFGSIEKKHGVDIVLKVLDYPTCITQYAAGSVDASCLANIDALNPAISRASTAICPTSTSVGADAVVAVGVDKPEDLKNVPVFGLKQSVTEYMIVRALEKLSLPIDTVQMVNMEPDAATQALQTGFNNVKAIGVWNPFKMTAARQTKEAKVVLSSETIPEEIIDLIVIGNDSLAKDGGDSFARLMCDTFYEINNRLADPTSGDNTLKALGEDFSALPLEDMRIVVKETRFYSTPDQAVKLFTSKEFPETMKQVVKTCEAIKIIEAGQAPSVGFDDSKARLNFTTKYLVPPTK